LKRDIKFLVVDDSMTMRKILVNSLKNLGYNKVIEADNDKDAYAKLISERPEIILADWNIPNSSCSNFIKSVRDNDKFKKLPILMLTSRGRQRDILEATKVNVTSFIKRPFTLQNLQEKINKILN
jgi:two-component system chemotaxis response regulator CheY